jgi:uncharacterized protein (UPF0332 family)
MPALKDKSEQNRSAFELLYRNELYASSVHCIYYHCLQFSKHILHTYCGIDYQEQNLSKGHGSHDDIRQGIMNNLSSITRNSVSSDFGRYFNRLKKLRVRADYSVEEISRLDATNAREFARYLNDILINQYINK